MAAAPFGPGEREREQGRIGTEGETRGSEREEAGERDELEGVSERDQGAVWRHRGVEEEPGRLGGRRWPGRVACARHRAASR